MRKVGALAADTLCAVGEFIQPGMTTLDINAFVHADTLKKGCIPAPLHYKGFPKSVCTSINQVVCHGIPDATVLKDGDIINVDVTHIFGGYHGDTSAMFYIGKPSPEAILVTEVARHSLQKGLDEVRHGARLGDIGAAIQTFAEAQGCSVVRDFSGHGIGKIFHEPPSVLHYGTRGQGVRLKSGMTITIEPMVNIGGWEVEVLADNWTAVTRDGSLSAQFEHTLLVTDTGYELLTARPRTLQNSEIFEGWTPPTEVSS